MQDASLQESMGPLVDRTKEMLVSADTGIIKARQKLKKAVEALRDKGITPPGVDPVHLGMVVVFNLMIGLLTPPMGLALFLVADIAKVSMKAILVEMAPFYVPLGVTLLMITYIPELTTWIPRLALSP